MTTWYKSGLEGYCKAAAALVGEPSSAEAWGRFCNDFLKDRDVTKPDIASRTWSMSRERQGNSNRLMKFEKAWLGYHANTYAKKQEKAWLDRCAGAADVGGFASAIDAAGAVGTANAIDAAGMAALGNVEAFSKAAAISECEARAVRTCVDSLMENGGEIYALTTNPTLSPSFAVCFHASVLPAIEKGFASEGYEASDIKGYSHVLDELVNRDLFDAGSLRDFCEALAAGLVYGPAHPLARSRPREATDYYVSENLDEAVSDNLVRVTQLFSGDLSAVGYSEAYEKDTAVFFGRCTEPGEYLAKCRSLYGAENADLMLALETGNAVVYPIAGKHTMTGNTHGVLAYVGEGWFYYDLDSTNGTSCARRPLCDFGQEIVEIDGLVRIEGGERLRLGAPVDADDEMLYRGATTVLVSFCIDEGEDF